MHSESLENILSKYQNDFYSVVPFHATSDKLLLMDFTSNNKELNEEILSDTNRFSQYINHQLKTHRATYGIGGYNEHRTIYSRSNVFNPANENEEPRRLHLGTDIWAEEKTPVSAPIDGIVHGFAFNNAYGDYGATIILTHNLEGKTFHTLYGHLSLNSIKNMQEGERIKKGDVFAEFGIPVENGSWPPHLHFQIIIDMDRGKGDYPGVCKLSEKESYLFNSPDPDLILQMMQYATKK